MMFGSRCVHTSREKSMLNVAHENQNGRNPKHAATEDKDYHIIVVSEILYLVFVRHITMLWPPGR
jgi:hypothetical protein